MYKNKRDPAFVLIFMQFTTIKWCKLFFSTLICKNFCSWRERVREILISQISIGKWQFMIALCGHINCVLLWTLNSLWFCFKQETSLRYGLNFV